MSEQPNTTKRPLTPSEAATLHAYCSKYSSDDPRPTPQTPAMIGLAVWFCGSTVAWFGIELGIPIAIGGAALVALAAVTAWQVRNWTPRMSPFEGSTQGEECWLDSKRVVFTIDDRGDGQLYALFELMDGSWFLLDDQMFPHVSDIVHTLSHGRIGWCSTDKGFPLWVRSDGERIPTHGVKADTTEAAQAAIDAGFCWSPGYDDSAHYSVDQLPPWMTDWSLEPVPFWRREGSE